MSEKPKEKPWQEEMTEIFNKAMEKFQSQMTQKPPLSSEPKSPHKTAQELADCPNCRKEYKVDEFEEKVKLKAKEDLIKALKERGSYEYGCKECGTPETYEEATSGECPTCHGKHAGNRDHI